MAVHDTQALPGPTARPAADTTGAGTTDAGDTDAGDEVKFTAAVEAYRHELQVHCYRMTASMDDAQELVQETFLRAWQARHRFQGRSSLRTWLYRIATNASLDLLRRSEHRRVNPAGELLAGSTQVSPYPDALLDRAEDGPDALAVQRETIELAFLTAIQHLPVRQRAAVVVRDVLGWTAVETADLLGTSVAAANSLLQRARTTLRTHLPPTRGQWRRPDATKQEEFLLARYMAAHARGDAGAMIALLDDDVRLAMPPEQPCIGIVQAVNFFTSILGPDSPGQWHLVPARMNRQPVAVNYARPHGDTTFRALSIDVLRIEDGRISQIDCFLGERVFVDLDLSLSLQV